MADYYPEPCQHGAPPIVEAAEITDLGAQMASSMPGLATVRYDCPTPAECRLVEAERRHAYLTT